MKCGSCIGVAWRPNGEEKKKHHFSRRFVYGARAGFETGSVLRFHGQSGKKKGCPFGNSVFAATHFRDWDFPLNVRGIVGKWGGYPSLGWWRKFRRKRTAWPVNRCSLKGDGTQRSGRETSNQCGYRAAQGKAAGFSGLVRLPRKAKTNVFLLDEPIFRGRGQTSAGISRQHIPPPAAWPGNLRVVSHTT